MTPIAAHHADTAQPLLPETSRRPCLLVVDDQPINVQALYRTFADDHRVLMATSGEKALAICRQDAPDLVLLDVVMPGMDGYEVCARLKGDDATRHIPVIFVTAHNDAQQETRGLEVGAVDFIAKPINPAVVRARVKTHLTLKAQSDLLREMVFIDGLTGVANRRRFDEQLSEEWRRAARAGVPIALLMLDVDHFKRYNDHYGHQAGDNCLQRVALALRGAVGRPGDLVARYGGEEFGCILPGADTTGALEVAERMEQAVRALGVAHVDSATAAVVTVSVGAAVCQVPTCPSTADGLVALADAQLYRAKAAGRGQVACSVMG